MTENMNVTCDFSVSRLLGKMGHFCAPDEKRPRGRRSERQSDSPQSGDALEVSKPVRR